MMVCPLVITCFSKGEIVWTVWEYSYILDTPQRPRVSISRRWPKSFCSKVNWDLWCWRSKSSWVDPRNRWPVRFLNGSKPSCGLCIAMAFPNLPTQPMRFGPGLDWQMWFVSLIWAGSGEYPAWFERFLEALLERRPSVVKLVDHPWQHEVQSFGCEAPRCLAHPSTHGTRCPSCCQLLMWVEFTGWVFLWAKQRLTQVLQPG